ncbi:ABC transporter substrate-binding protein [Acidocella sp.]|uniref:glycine betaine ABC transporter substrate-binding protein OsmF n=1 Tax=Acidocella sp. TaxID=50710 RepID=UPI0026296630|nr:ABC transporter substrate-binding protein [Acidocella sp.]
MRKRYISLLQAALGLFLCMGAAKAQVVVSSKIDTEGSILGTMIIDVLNAHGIPTVNKLQLGGTPIVRKALLAGQIDIYPEYTGNAAYFFHKTDEPIWSDPSKAYNEAKTLDMAVNHIVWLTPAPADNSWAIALRKDVSQPHHIVTFSDFARYLNNGGKIKLAASAEFVNSPAALPAFEKAYGFTLKPRQLLILSGGDTMATITAAARNTNDVNAAMVYTTDGGIAASGLVVLADDKHVEPVYQPAPIIRAAVLARYPAIADLLKPVFLSLTTPVLQDLNGKVEVGGEAVQAVVGAYLHSKGFLK